MEATDPRRGDESGRGAGLRLPGAPRARPRTVLVLGGGGMRGMAHIGVLKAMQTLGLGYDAIVGTSIGAVVGAMAAGGRPIEEIEGVVTDIQKADYFRLNLVKFLLKGARAPSMYRGDTFRESLSKVLPEGRCGDLGMPFFCNAIRLETGGSVFFGTPGFEDLSVLDAVYASCALPGVFEPLEWQGHHYMDGGIVDAVPLRFAKTLGPDLVIAVDLSVKATHKSPDYKSRVLSTMYRAFEIVEEVLTEHSLHMHVDYQTVLIQPKIAHLSRFDFQDVPAVIRIGEEEALRVLVSHAATRDLVAEQLPEGMTCPILPRDFVSIRLDPELCIGCGMCEMVCETDAFWARGEKATVRKLANYECTRDHACARNCPTEAIRLGNL